jgi:hypothetical protein
MTLTPAMAASVSVVIDNPTNLHVNIECFPEVMRLFPREDRYKSSVELLRSVAGPEDIERIGAENFAISKLVAHQMSFSGLGTKAGGRCVIGGVATTRTGCAQNSTPATKSSPR